MATLVEGINLHYLGGGSDKLYNVSIVEDGGKYECLFEYGKRGRTLRPGKKTPTPTSYSVAKAAYDKIVGEQLKQGYNVVGRSGTGSTGSTGGASGGTGGKPATPPAPPVKQSFGYLPQLLNPVLAEALEALFEDDDWVAQEKYDGERVPTRVTATGVEAGNREGLLRALPAPVLAELETLETGTRLDGELVGDTYYVFDALAIGGLDLMELPLTSRLAAMNAIPFARLTAIKRVATAVTEFEKRALFDRVKAAKGEGVVFKRAASKVCPGRPTSGGDWLKFKFVESATCIVAGLNAAKRSVKLELIDGAARVAVGNVTIPPNHSVPSVGTLCEVQYLYAYEGGSLYQPVYKGPRTDLSISAAVLSQLKYKPEAAAAA